ncbi:MAG: formyltransferase family protein, partial [Actinomycetota bacterium]
MRIGVLASGGGTILDAIGERDLPVVVVVTDRRCGATEVAHRHGIPALTVERSSYGGDFDRDAFTDRVLDALDDHDVELVAMAGFGTILGPSAFERLPGRILNTHPAAMASSTACQPGKAGSSAGW